MANLATYALMYPHITSLATRQRVSVVMRAIALGQIGGGAAGKTSQSARIAWAKAVLKSSASVTEDNTFVNAVIQCLVGEPSMVNDAVDSAGDALLAVDVLNHLNMIIFVSGYSPDIIIDV